MKRPGATKYKLAEMLCRATGWLVEADDFAQNHPMHIKYQDVCCWDVWATVPAKDGRPPHKAHIYSWDTMGEIVKSGGVEIVGGKYHEEFDIEVCCKNTTV